MVSSRAMVVSRSEQATSAVMGVLCVFQVALAAGMPWGRAAYGGAHHGRLPGHLRTISAVAALGYGGGAALVLSGSGSLPARTRAFTAFSCLMGVGTVVNGASRSPVERALWTPVAAAASVLAWRSRTARV